MKCPVQTDTRAAATEKQDWHTS